ncbi:hypothetical protein ACIRQQ_33675 [Streptomyces fuscichromogenes]|uniref:hypothetical protein n=1 Tax=Streptomyces fuscichromogenes TaxID=1324013 RepID=UPI0038004503
MSSSKSRRRTRSFPFAVFLALSTTTLTACSGSGGKALDGGGQAANLVGYEHTQVGEEYWVTMPEMSNNSGKPITVLSAKIVDVPAGLRITGYRVANAGTGGHPIGVIPVGATDGIGRASAHKGGQIQIKPHALSSLYYEARVKVTGPVHGDLTTCRYEYRQGSVTYHEDLGCDTRIRLGGPLKK